MYNEDNNHYNNNRGDENDNELNDDSGDDHDLGKDDLDNLIVIVTNVGMIQMMILIINDNNNDSMTDPCQYCDDLKFVILSHVKPGLEPGFLSFKFKRLIDLLLNRFL